MNILLLNDDGFESVGTQLLAKIIEKSGHTVFQALPKNNCSGVSSGVHFHSDIEIYEHNTDFIIINGSPVDCVLIGVDYFLKRGNQIDLVISGINQGMNIGLARRYSGTLAIAYEALNQGFPAIAISSHVPVTELDINVITTFMISLLDKYVMIYKKYGAIGINVNIYSSKNLVSYCNEAVVVNVHNKLLDVIECENLVYQIGIKKTLPPIDTKGKTIILGIITTDILKYDKNILNKIYANLSGEIHEKNTNRESNKK